MIMNLSVFVISCVLLQSGAIVQEARPTVDDLAWLTGCWAGGDTSGHFVEHWMKPAGGMMIGMSRTVANDKIREYEFLQIRQEGNGDIYYIAVPSGQKETWFKLVRFREREVVFENPQHDFPQRIIYRIENDSVLVARVEGSEQSADFRMKHVACN